MGEPIESGQSSEAINALVSVAASDAVDPPPTLRERVVASHERPGRYGIFVDRLARLFDLPMPEITTLLTRIESEDAWVPFLVPGTEMIPVNAGAKRAGAITSLVRIHPGVPFPEHTHRGVETMVVIDGGFVVPSSKKEVWRGEELTSEDGSEHSLVGLPGVPCVAAVVITGHADFK